MAEVPSNVWLVTVALIFIPITATSITWTAPPPAWTQTDSAFVRTVDMQVLLGSTLVPLRWNYTLLSGTVLSTTFYIDGDDVGSIFHSIGITSVNNRNDYQTRFAISTSEVATLIINKVTEREYATYQCKVVVSGNSWAYNIRVNVTVAAKLTNVSGNQTVHEGSNMQLVCEAAGKPTPNITWTRVLGDDSNSEVIHQGPTWNFPNIRRTASGAYRCTAYNGFGNPVSKEVKVNVLFIASTLINVTLTITSESCNDGKYNQSLLWRKLNETINMVFASESGYNSARLVNVRCGSVVVDLALKFNSTLTEREVITILRNAAKNGRLGEFNV